MAQQYAKDQSAGFVNQIRNVAIVGAGGRMGEDITKEVLKTGKHNVTAITRPDSTSKIPEGCQVKHVDYNDHSSLVNALRGQDCLVITMAVTAPPDSSEKLVRAAADAGVPWILPNEWGTEYEGKLGEELIIGPAFIKIRNLIKDLGTSSYVSVINGFWYEYSLSSGPLLYGFDFPNKTVTFYDDGETPLLTSTIPHCARAAAKLLSLNILPEDANDKSTTLSSFRNTFCRIYSFKLSQKDMLASVLRVTGDSEKDWTIKKEDVKQRYADGMAAMQKGDRRGFGKLLYARIFFPDGAGSWEHKGTFNDTLGLPQDDLDTYTKIAVDSVKRNMESGVYFSED